MATKKDFIVKNGLIVTDDITLDDGGSLKEAGGTAAFTFDGSGNVTKIGQDSPSSGEFLKWDGSKWVADAVSSGVGGSISEDQVAVGSTTADEIEGSAGFTAALGGSGSTSVLKFGLSDGTTNYTRLRLNGTNAYLEFRDASDNSKAALGFQSTQGLKFFAKAGGLGATEALRITPDDEWGLQGANYGTAGQVLTSGGSGAAVSWTTISGGDVVDDTTPQLGGNLDVNGNKITSVSNGNIVLEPNGSGKVQIGDTTYNPSGITTGKLTVTRDETEGSDTGPTLMLVDGDSDANNGPILKMYRNTDSPADGDALGTIGFDGEDSAGGERSYARIRAISDNATSGSNDGSLEFRVFANGTQTDVMQLEPDAQAGAKMTLMGVSQTGAVVSGTSTANTAYLSLIEVATADHKAITASVHITDSTNNEVQTEMIVAHFDGTTVNYTTYGQIYDGAAAIGALEATYVPIGSKILIRFQNTQGSTATLAGSVHVTLHP